MAAIEKLDDGIERVIAVLLLASVAVAAFAYAAYDNFYFAAPAALIVAATVLWVGRMWINRKHRFLLAPVIWPLLAFIGYAAWRHHVAEVPYFSRQDLAGAVIFATVGLLAVQNLHRQAGVQWTLYALIGVGTLESVAAVVQCIRQSDHVFGVLKPEIYTHRFGGTFINPNHLAGFLVIPLALSVAQLFLGRASAMVKIALAYAALVIAGGIAVTLSRGGWIGAGIALAVLAAWLARKPQFRIPVAIFAVLTVGGIIFALSHSDRAMTRLEGTTDLGARQSGMSRPWIWKPTLRMWRDHALYGVGPGHFNVYFPQYRPAEVQTDPEFAHNEYLNILADYGAAGAGIALAGLAVVGWTLWKTSKHAERSHGDLGIKNSNRTAFFAGSVAGLIGFAVHTGFEFLLHIPAIAIELAIVGGVLMSNIRFATERFWLTPNWASRLLASAVVLGSLAWWVPEVYKLAVEDRHLMAVSRSSVIDGNYLHHLQSAMEIEPGNPRSRYILGENYRQLSWQGDAHWKDWANSALKSLQASIQLDPHYARSWLSMALTASWLDDTNNAAKWFDEASSRGGQDIEIANRYSWYLLSHGQPQRAIEYASAATNWYHWNWTAKHYIQQSESLLRDQSKTNAAAGGK